MDIIYIEEFVVLAEVCNYGRAADTLFISQSSLFNHIKALEGELGVALFNRKGKKIVLSDYGQMFLPYATTIITASKEYMQTIQDVQDQNRQRLIIGTQYRIIDLIKEVWSRSRSSRVRRPVPPTGKISYMPLASRVFL